MATIDKILQMKEDRDVKNLILNLNDDNDDIRAFIAQTLGDMGGNESIESLHALLNDTSLKVRKEAAMSLGLISDASSVEPLIKALKDESEEVRQIAAFSLIKIDDELSIGPLKDLLDDISQNVRAIASLGINIFNQTDLNFETQLDDYSEKLQLNIKPESFLQTPKVILELISKIALNSNPETILDPASGRGSLILELEKILKSDSNILAVGMNKEFFKDFDENKNIKLIFGDFFEFKEKNKDKFDLIVSDMFIHNINIENIAKQDIKFKIGLLLESLELLSEDGRLIFLVPEYFLYSEEHQTTRNFIIKQYSLEGVISIPSRISYLYSSVKASLLIIKNSKINKAFFAEYKNESSLEPIIYNFTNHKTNKNPSQGFFIDFSIIKKRDTTWTFKYLKDLKIPIALEKTDSDDFKLLSEITKVKTKSQHNSLAFPKDPLKTKDFKFKLSKDIEKDEEDQFYYYVIKDQKILSNFLILFLNSEEVQVEIKKIISEQKYISELNTIQIPILDEDIQDKILEAYEKSKVLRNKIDLLEQKFKKSIFEYLELIETADLVFQHEMLWPIVNSYLAINSLNNLNEIIMKYFNYFEFITAFNSIVLLSSIPKNLLIDKKNFIFPKNFSKPAFGHWLNLNLLLRELFIIMDKNKSFFKSLSFNKEFYSKLTDKQFLNDISNVINLRNEYIHGGGNKLPITDKLKLIKRLNTIINKSFKILEVYLPIELIYTTKLDKNNGLYTIGVKKLQGHSYPFQETYIETEEDMDTNALYLYNPNTDKRIKLKGELIRLEECDKCGRISLYVFNKLSFNKTQLKNTYRSYQDEIHPFYNSDSDLKDLIS